MVRLIADIASAFACLFELRCVRILLGSRCGGLGIARLLAGCSTEIRVLLGVRLSLFEGV